MQAPVATADALAGRPTVIATSRLRLCRLVRGDAPFILELLNDPLWLLHIGDRGVRTLEDARRYIEEGPVDMYARLGFGLFLVQRADDGVPMGMCGLLKRDYLDDVDLGFAFLPAYRGRGYALEAAAGTIAHARAQLGARRLLAITSQTNLASGRLLERLGFRFERNIRASPDPDELKLFVLELT